MRRHAHVVSRCRIGSAYYQSIINIHIAHTAVPRKGIVVPVRGVIGIGEPRDKNTRVVSIALEEASEARRR